MINSKYISAAAYIFGRNKNGEWCILCGRRVGNDPRFQGGLYNVPVGMREEGESSVENARRECFEETGLNFLLSMFRFIGEDEWAPGKVGANFLVIVNDIEQYETGKGDWENERFVWMPLSEIGKVRWAYGMNKTIVQIFKENIERRMNESKKKKKINNKNCAGILGYENDTEFFAYDNNGCDGCCLSESEIRTLLREAVREGQGFNFFKSNTKSLWNGDDNMDDLKDKWNELGNSDGGYNSYIKNGKNNAAYYGKDEEWYDEDGDATDISVNLRTGKENGRLDTSIGGRLGRKLGMAGVRAQIPFRMAAEPVYKARRDFKKIVEESVNEALDKYFAGGFKDYLTNNDNLSKDLDVIAYDDNYLKFPDFLRNNGYYDEEWYDEVVERCHSWDESLIDDIANGVYGNDMLTNFAEWLRHKLGYKPTREVMDYEGVVKVNDKEGGNWFIHFSDDAEYIWDEGFRYATEDYREIGYSGAGDTLRKSNEGLCFAYNIKNTPSRMFFVRAGVPKYGEDAVMFQANAVKAYHYGDEEKQSVFYNNDARNIVLLKNIDSVWSVIGNDGSIVFADADIDRVMYWVIDNFEQYRKLLTKPNESRLRNDRMMKGVYGKQSLNELFDKVFTQKLKDMRNGDRN